MNQVGIQSQTLVLIILSAMDHDISLWTGLMLSESGARLCLYGMRDLVVREWLRLEYS